MDNYRARVPWYLVKDYIRATEAMVAARQQYNGQCIVAAETYYMAAHEFRASIHDAILSHLGVTRADPHVADWLSNLTDHAYGFIR